MILKNNKLKKIQHGLKQKREKNVPKIKVLHKYNCDIFNFDTKS